MRAPWAVLLILAVPMAGCSGENAFEESMPGDGLPNDGENLAEEAEIPRLGEPVPRTFYFTQGLSIEEDLPSEGAVPVGVAASGFVLGVDFVRFESEPFRESILIEPQPVRVPIWFRYTGPTVSNGAFDVGAWFGSTRGMPLGDFWTHPVSPVPGTTTAMEVTLDFGTERGILVPKGESLVMDLAVGFVPNQGSNLVELLVGGETASGFVLATRTYTVDPLEGLRLKSPTTLTGQVTQVFAATDCDTLPGTTSLPFDVPVDADSDYLSLSMVATSGFFPMRDLDFSLFQAGTQVSGSHTGYDDEKILLAAETLEGLAGQTLRLVVVACSMGQIGFEVTVEQGTLPEEDAPEA